MSNTHWYPAFIGVGSNLQSPTDQVQRAIKILGNSDNCILVSQSGLYRSPPLCGRDQPDYINAVVAMLTTCEPLPFLGMLQHIETTQGRTRTGDRWEPRVIDLDLLAFAGCRLDTEELVLPHPGIVERNFVLLPWREIAPHFPVPGLASVDKLASRLDKTDAEIAKLEMT